MLDKGRAHLGRVRLIGQVQLLELAKDLRGRLHAVARARARATKIRVRMVNCGFVITPVSMRTCAATHCSHPTRCALLRVCEQLQLQAIVTLIVNPVHMHAACGASCGPRTEKTMVDCKCLVLFSRPRTRVRDLAAGAAKFGT